MSGRLILNGSQDSQSRNKLFLHVLILLIISASSFYLGYKLSLQAQANGIPLLSSKIIVSPDAEDIFISLINSANKSIDVEVYLFSNKNLANAVIAAKARGVTVRIILENRIEGDTNDEVIALLKAAGVDLRFASTDFKLTHSKFFIIDRAISVVGSHNWTGAALTKNRETSILTTEVMAVKQLLDLFENDWSIASPV